MHFGPDRSGSGCHHFDDAFRLSTWQTDEERTTDASGVCQLSAFVGDYEIVVGHAGRTVTVKTTVDKLGRTVTVVL